MISQTTLNNKTAYTTDKDIFICGGCGMNCKTLNEIDRHIKYCSYVGE